MIRINIEVRNDNAYALPPNSQIHINNYNYGWIYSSSINLYRKEKIIKLDVIEYQNYQPVKLGEIKILKKHIYKISSVQKFRDKNN
ncbi:MAG: hypothetical protein ACK5MD_06905 [Flavobacteriales bacterium]